MHVARYWRNRKLRYQLIRRVLRPERDLGEARPVEAAASARRRENKAVKELVA